MENIPFLQVAFNSFFSEVHHHTLAYGLISKTIVQTFGIQYASTHQQAKPYHRKGHSFILSQV